jgi:hypothetical protein
MHDLGHIWAASIMVLAYTALHLLCTLIRLHPMSYVERTAHTKGSST